MPELTRMPNPGEMPPMSPDDIRKRSEYERGKKIQMRNGSIVMVNSLEEEIALKKTETENN